MGTGQMRLLGQNFWSFLAENLQSALRFHPLLAVLDLEKLPETQIFLRGHRIFTSCTLRHDTSRIGLRGRAVCAVEGFRRKVPPLSDFIQALQLQIRPAQHRMPKIFPCSKFLCGKRRM